MQWIKPIAIRATFIFSLLTILFVLANWIIPGGIIEKIYSVQHDIENGAIFRRFDIYKQLLLELRLTVFSLTPVALVGWLALLAKRTVKKIQHEFLVIYLLLFIAMFYVAMVQQRILITVRYGIVLYPIVAILAAIGFAEFFSRYRWQKYVLTGVIVFASTISLWSVKPFYFNYSNSLLNKDQLINDAWGYGGYEAAQYLNSLPNAQNLVVWADYRGFCAFFKGTCVEERKTEGKYDSEVDYFINTRRGSIIFENRWDWLQVTYLGGLQYPVWEMAINGNTKNYIKIYNNISDRQ